jgi:Family of unknown function (DUF6520)
MKKRFALIASTFLVALSFAFATKNNAKTSAFVQSGTSCTAVANPCAGNNRTCTISGVTYFAQQSGSTCISPLKMQ